MSRGAAYIIWSAQEVCFLCSPLGECLWQEEEQQQEEKEEESSKRREDENSSVSGEQLSI